LKATHRFLFFVDEVNVLNEKVNIILTSMDALDGRYEGLDVEINTEKTKHMLVSYHQNIGGNHNLKFGNKRLKYMAELKCGGTIVTSELNQQGNKGRLSSRNAFPLYS
jgi:hypothetical protein